MLSAKCQFELSKDIVVISERSGARIIPITRLNGQNLNTHRNCIRHIEAQQWQRSIKNRCKCSAVLREYEKRRRANVQLIYCLCAHLFIHFPLSSTSMLECICTSRTVFCCSGYKCEFETITKLNRTHSIISKMLFIGGAIRFLSISFDMLAVRIIKSILQCIDD